MPLYRTVCFKFSFPISVNWSYKLAVDLQKDEVLPVSHAANLTKYNSNLLMQVFKTVYVIISITAPQDAYNSLVLQVYLGSNTLEFSAIRG